MALWKLLFLKKKINMEISISEVFRVKLAHFQIHAREHTEAHSRMKWVRTVIPMVNQFPFAGKKEPESEIDKNAFKPFARKGVVVRPFWRTSIMVET